MYNKKHNHQIKIQTCLIFWFINFVFNTNDLTSASVTLCIRCIYEMGGYGKELIIMQNRKKND